VSVPSFKGLALADRSERGDWIEVLEGLAYEESAITTGSFALKSEMNEDEIGGEERGRRR